PLVLTTILLFLICRSPFPNAVKLGLLFGIFSMVISYNCQLRNDFAELRPETNEILALFAGLVALESARLKSWNLTELFVGSFLITYAAGHHYPAAVAISGIGVYVAWSWWSLGITRATKPFLAMLGGACLFGIPFIAFFVLPHWKGMWAMLTAVQWHTGAETGLTQ